MCICVLEWRGKADITPSSAEGVVVAIHGVEEPPDISMKLHITVVLSFPNVDTHVYTHRNAYMLRYCHTDWNTHSHTYLSLKKDQRTLHNHLLANVSKIRGFKHIRLHAKNMLSQEMYES